MLRIDIIKFEAQDAITTSVPRPASGKDCECSDFCRYYPETGVIEHDSSCACERYGYEDHYHAHQET